MALNFIKLDKLLVCSFKLRDEAEVARLVGLEKRDCQQKDVRINLSHSRC